MQKKHVNRHSNSITKITTFCQLVIAIDNTKQKMKDTSEMTNSFFKFVL